MLVQHRMVPCGWLRFVIVVFPDHTHLLFLVSFVIFQGIGTSIAKENPIFL